MKVMTRAKTAYVSGMAPEIMALARVFLPFIMLLMSAAQLSFLPNDLLVANEDENSI